MNKLIVKVMFFVGMLSLGSSLLQSELSMIVGSLTFTLGLFILGAGFVKPITFEQLFSVYGLITVSICICCLFVMPVLDALMLIGWVSVSVLISFSRKPQTGAAV